jgi:hypothetical protein
MFEQLVNESASRLGLPVPGVSALMQRSKVHRQERTSRSAVTPTTRAIRPAT